MHLPATFLALMVHFQPKFYLSSCPSHTEARSSMSVHFLILFSCCAVVENTPADAAVVDKEQGKSEQSVLLRPRPDPVTALSTQATHRNNPVPIAGSHLPAKTARHKGLCAPNDLELSEDSVVSGTSCSLQPESQAPREIQDGWTLLPTPSQLLKVPQPVAAIVSTSDEVPVPTAQTTYIPNRGKLPSAKAHTTLPHSECIC